ncbi:hypothetical protein CAPTEDRAFT_176950 [Capitella teleta]|uniref:Dehydrogenase/reductase SDR family member 7 n=1 Tax=Capitella teleta TaxID=283909 RepID=R7VGA8_CAPTE|nr:hypothetical protein CAPTEDRAFT_176950 [Capitella teleta]|eukprot:ELU14700.1 hypothetical protein CAPTEDRAFT_176950 [Capitella teleta]
MHFVVVGVVLLAVYFIIQLVRFVRADGDLTLMWADSFGHRIDSLKGQVVWITGASSSIGEGLAYELAKVGCKLVLSARREAHLQRVKEQCLTCGPMSSDDVLVLPLDLTEFDTHKGATDKVIQHFGRIDILVNNGGRSQRAWIKDTDIGIDRDMFNLNVLGQISLSKEVLPIMRQQKAGTVMVNSSVAGKMALPFSASYCMTKYCLTGWFEALRVEGREDGINVCLVYPGPTVSNFTLHAFTGEKGEVWGKPMGSTEHRLSTQRCAELMAVSLANKLEEVWVSLQPVLAMVYLNQYAPDTSRWLQKVLGMKMINKIREGRL